MKLSSDDLFHQQRVRDLREMSWEHDVTKQKKKFLETSHHVVNGSLKIARPNDESLMR